MRPSIRNRGAASLLLGVLLAALVATPAVGGSGGDPDGGRDPGRAAGVAAADLVASLAPASVVIRKPDGRIRLGTHGYPGNATPYGLPYVGNNVYNATGTRQRATAENFNELEGAFYTFDISIQNDGTRADRFKVKATGAATAGWTVTYVRGTTNITSAIVAGTYRTPLLAPGATYLIRARITITEGGNLTRLVTIRSVADPTKIDAVKFAYKPMACGC